MKKNLFVSSISMLLLLVPLVGHSGSLFRIYSMTKPVVGVAMMMLYEEGYYPFADPLAKHIPELADLMVYAGEDDDGNIVLEEPTRAPTIN